MDPIFKSILTSVCGTVAGAIVGWAIKQGFVSADQASALTGQIGSILIGAVGVAAAAAIAWYKALQHTKAAQIQAVNAADNGVKVVPATAPTPAVSEPLK